MHAYRRDTEIEAIVKPHYATMCGLVQLESGECESFLSIRYEKIGLFVWKRQRSTGSYGYFTVDAPGLKAFKVHLLNVLHARAPNIVKGVPSNIPYPEYQPKEFRGAKERL